MAEAPCGVLRGDAGEATPECELPDRRRFASQAEARVACFSFIEGFYSPVLDGAADEGAGNLVALRRT